MTARPAYTPYDGTSKPFTIGLSALDPSRWIEPDDELPLYLDEKKRLLATEHDSVFQETPGSEAGQRECLDLIAGHLVVDHADRFRREGSRILFAPRSVDIADAAVPALLRAGSLVQDDLAILTRKPDGWYLAAGFIAFPSAWSLKEKAGLPMEGVHAHVPGFEGGTRNATMINRIFDNLKPDLPAVRLNWSIYPAGELYWPPERGARAEARHFNPVGNFIRVERQTLRRLPETGDIVFTIRIYNDPLAALASAGEGPVLAHALADRLEAFTPEQLAYKGMLSKQAALVEYLRSL